MKAKIHLNFAFERFLSVFHEETELCAGVTAIFLNYCGFSIEISETYIYDVTIVSGKPRYALSRDVAKVMAASYR